jgi:hypothetical protein
MFLVTIDDALDAPSASPPIPPGRHSLAQGREGKPDLGARPGQNVGNGARHSLRLRPIRATLGVPPKRMLRDRYI